MNHVKLSIENYVQLLKRSDQLDQFKRSKTIYIRNVGAFRPDVIHTDDIAVEKLTNRINFQADEISALRLELSKRPNTLTVIHWWQFWKY